MIHNPFSDNQPISKKYRLLFFVAAFGLVGGFIILLTYAAAPTGPRTNHFEPEEGTGTALVGTDQSASSGHYVTFKPPACAAGTTGQPPNCTAITGTDITTYGAKGDGVTDDTAALNKAFSTAPANSTLIIPAGKTFMHTKSLFVTVAGLHITGTGTILATNQLDSALQLRSSNVLIDGGLLFKFTMPGAVRQYAGWEAMIFVDHVTGTVIRNITVDGGPSIGILMYGASNYVIDGVTVMNTLADAIHNTNGSHDGIIKNPVIKNCADDGVAIVSYLGDGVMTYNIQVISPKVYGQPWGRGFTVVGGHDVTFTNVYVDGSAGAGIYIAAEPSYNTYGVYNVKVLGGTLLKSNSNTAISHGAVLVYNQQPTQAISNIDIENITIQSTHLTAPRQVGILGNGGGGISGLQMRNFTITGGPTNVLTNDAPAAAYNTLNWIMNGTRQTDHVGFTAYP